MKEYIGTKRISAMCIAIIDPSSGGGISTLHGHIPGEFAEVDAGWMERHHPKEGGYFVEYEDGYTSYSPVEAFQRAYRAVEDGLPLGGVIAGLWEGKNFARKGWNGKGIYITLQVPDENSKMSQPYIYITTTQLQSDNVDALRGRVPWLASQTDMLAWDWVEVTDL